MIWLFGFAGRLATRVVLLVFTATYILGVLTVYFSARHVLGEGVAIVLAIGAVLAFTTMAHEALNYRANAENPDDYQ